MRWTILCAASLAGGVLFAGYAWAQGRPEGSGTLDSRPGEFTGGNVPFPSPSQPFSRFDFNELWAFPGNKNTEGGLGKEERPPNNPDGPPDERPDAPPSGPAQNSRAAKSEELKSKELKSEELKKALAPKPAPEAVRKEMIDALLERLQKASDPEDAQHIAETVEHLWLQSFSDTTNLLMQRAMTSTQAGQYPLALSLLDKLIALEPDWAEAWNQRATVRFLSGDADGAMDDIRHVTKLEPRHFLALSGMGMILEQEGLDKAALEIFNKVLVIYPLELDIQSRAKKLMLKVEGQDI